MAPVSGVSCSHRRGRRGSMLGSSPRTRARLLRTRYPGKFWRPEIVRTESIVVEIVYDCEGRYRVESLTDFLLNVLLLPLNV